MLRPPTDDPDQTRLTALLFRNHTLSDTVALDRRLYTSHHNLRMTGTVNTARNSFHGCTLHAARLSSYCTRPHPSTVPTASHQLHTRPPDIPAPLAYQRPLVNTYCTSDLCRPRARDEVQNARKHDGRVAGIPPRQRSSSSDILHTRGPPNIGPRGGGVSRPPSPNLTTQHWRKPYHKILESFVEKVSDVRRRATGDGQAAAPGESLES
jgi:hypothetical protein